MPKILGQRIQDRLRGWGTLRSQYSLSPYCLSRECVRGADRIEALERALQRVVGAWDDDDGHEMIHAVRDARAALAAES